MAFSKLTFSFVFLLTTFSLKAQIGIGIATPDPSSILQLQSTNKGFLLPRMTAGQRLGITSPANGLLVYDIDSASIFMYSPSTWKKIAAAPKLDSLIKGSIAGDVLQWNGNAWVVTNKKNLFNYYFRDKDGDGFGDKYIPIQGTTPLPGFVNDSTDCNDNDALINPNGTWYQDLDHDGFGNSSVTASGCNPPSNYVTHGNDCNDNDAAINPSVIDLPDDGFSDQNCDGIDGDTSKAVFVAVSGNDANPGTITSPKKTINAAIATAVNAGKKQVYISAGNYLEVVDMKNGISVYGGYSTTWSRGSANQVTIQGGLSSEGSKGLTASNITSATFLDRVKIQSPNTNFPGLSAYGIIAENAPGLNIKNVTVIAGNGGNGNPGPNAFTEGGSSQGMNGMQSNCNSSSAFGEGGSGGSSSCPPPGNNTYGGKGGNGGIPNSTNAGPGLDGYNNPNSGGIPGSSGDPGSQGLNGKNGQTGAAGANGTATGQGSIVGSLWVPANGLNGSYGLPGTGGGGGGGGGATFCTFCARISGNGGGGGGAGGCGGAGGLGGQGGGASLGILVLSSTGITIFNCNITSGNGGNGGSGGNRGLGLPGKPGGIGAISCSYSAHGGNGGAGGEGGPGGFGAGGSGGVSFAIYRVSTIISNIFASNTLSNGSGGIGGGAGVNPGQNGNSGIMY